MHDHGGMLTSKLKILFIIVGLLSAAVPAAAQSLKVPFAALSPTYAPLWIADQAGFFKKYGLDVQLVYISAGSVLSRRFCQARSISLT